MIALNTPHGFLGISPQISAVIDQIPKIAKSKVPVLIEGETGTGKDLYARMLHECSPRKTNPFQVVDCGAIPPALFSRELCGHVKGAFTSAETHAQGRLRSADGGTVLFQGIQHLDASSQSALLQVLDKGEVLPLGSVEPVQVNLRFVQSSQVSLEKKVHDGSFRQDLFYRMNGLTIRIPPLRERRDDLEFLLEHFLRTESSALRRNIPQLSRELRECFLRYEWPGNVSELKHSLRGLLTLSPEDKLGIQHLSAEQQERMLVSKNEKASNRIFSIPSNLPFNRQVESFQRSLILRAWGESGQNRAALLEKLQFAPHQLKYLLKKLMIELPEDQE